VISESHRGDKREGQGRGVGENKSKLFTTPVSKLNQGVVHALVLQLLAAGIPSIYVNGNKEGTSHLSTSDFIVIWG
jgi:hypothetical protein